MRRTMVISGGSDGLGREIAKKLVPKHNVVILSRNAHKLQKAAHEIGCHYIPCDITQYKNCVLAINQIISLQGQIDCLINNAGVWIEGQLDTSEPSTIEEAIRVNTLGTIYLTKSVIPSMKKHKSGKIINIIYQAGTYAKNGQSVYNASKWAITGFTNSLQAELSPFGIGVTGVYPERMKAVASDIATTPLEVAKIVSYVVELPNYTVIPEIEIKYIKS